VTPEWQGCQMVHIFEYQKSKFGIFRKVLGYKGLVHIFHGNYVPTLYCHLVNVLKSYSLFFPFWYVVPKSGNRDEEWQII
jgi:hypothetical protein